MENEALTRYVGAFVAELVKNEVSDVVVSPGSRSTPMAMLMAEHPKLKVWIQIDERSAGYFALGMAKAKRKPVALLCTSGTAAANYFPAIVEAHSSRVPLIVITTDRPHELRDVGAPQAIDQLGIYGRYAKWFVEMALPDNSQSMLNYVRTTATRAVAVSLMGQPGVVHLNFPFREPLIPDLSLPDLWEGVGLKTSTSIQVLEAKRILDQAQVNKLAQELQGTENGLIICGPEDLPELAEAVTHLAEALQYPILADPLSQMRSGSFQKEWLIDSYDAFLRNQNIKVEFKPEVIIRFGAMPISKALLQYLQAHPTTRQIIIDQAGGWREPTHLASDMIYADPAAFCIDLTRLLEKTVKQTDWGTKWKQINQFARSYLHTHGQTEQLFEGRVFIELQQLLPNDSILFVANSMPVRDMDTFFAVTDRQIRTMANRGANGIDGVVSSAIGASTNAFPLVLVIGDLSFYHDLNGLLATKLQHINITIILINNDGGGIFSFLPQAKHFKHFEKLFGTPLGIDFEYVVKMYDGSFARIKDWDEFRQAVNQGLSTEGLSVIEVQTERKQSFEQHRWMWQSLSNQLDKYLETGGWNK